MFGSYVKSNDKASFARQVSARGETVRAPCQCRRAATLEQSVMNGTIHSRYRMAKMLSERKDN